MPDSPVCPSCGAIGRPGADRCELCGTAYADAEAAAAAGGAEACATCGAVNPSGARFCNQCGRELAAPASSPPAVADRPTAVADRPTADSAPGRRALGLIGLGLAIVAGLYGATLWSQQRSADAPPLADDAVAAADPIPDGPTPPLSAVNQPQADAFEAEGTAEGWYESGRFYLTAAFEARETNPVQSAQWARRAVANFERSLEVAPDPDVQLAIAEAAQFDPATPMRPVTELQTLLETYPDHVGANLMMGERRLMIGRYELARESFERVVSLTDPGDPVRERAELALATVATQTSG